MKTHNCECCGGRLNQFYHSPVSYCRKKRVELKLEDFDTLGSKGSIFVNLKPSGKYLMEDFFYAGGLPLVLKQLQKYLHSEQ